ncbi:unnamed protein product [Penicillium egyptiacum]|uniref:Peptide N-acetyl-beta-D-glucosaminyl asparaginase amidase A N-terminal domain-containing protein n=1 Tax=Penicillium egyptiacum TaxID=1303716 RepID=A0A9W4P6P0_9EURO|nr:unnamed protein product [Penicillium egyptiacum]
MPPRHLSPLLTDLQSPMEYCFTRLAAWFLSILLFWLVVTFCNVFKSHRRSWNRSSVSLLSQEPLKPQETYTTANAVWPIDHCDSKSKVDDTRSKLRRVNPNFRLVAIMVLFGICGLLLLGHLPSASSLQSGVQSITGFPSQAPSSTDLQEFFQLYSPISLDSGGNDNCDVEILLMDHVFGSSYGEPFVGRRSRMLLLLVSNLATYVGDYEPPNCDFDTVRINLTVTSRGKQFDRLALMYLGDNEVFRTSTAEPTANGIVWTYVKEMSQYNSLWKSPQKLIFDLGNIINDVYTGSFNATLTAHFSEGQNVKTADMVFPISAKKSASNSSSAFQLPTDNTTVMYVIPAAASRAIVSISACGQSEEEFWWSNVFSEDTRDFESTVGGLYGYTPFREVQLYIDGILAGLVWPFPIIFTGGVAPGFWRPVVGTDAFDLRQPEIDISPFLPMVQDGKQHSFEIRVTGLNASADGSATFADTVGSYWVVTGNIFIYIDGNRSDSTATVTRDKNRPTVNAPLPVLAVTRNLIHNETGGNDSLSYSVVVKRVFSAESSLYSWSQTLSFSNYGLLNQQGYSQVNRQLTTGNNTITELGHAPISNSVSFQYPLVVNATYGITSNGTTIDSWMKRGLNLEATGGVGISTYTLTSGPSYLHTSQSGTAQYKSVTGGSSSSWGDTINVFESQMNGQSYNRSVHAVNGTVVSDTDPKAKVSASAAQGRGDTGRDSVRAIVGKGPGILIN